MIRRSDLSTRTEQIRPFQSFKIRPFSAFAL